MLWQRECMLNFKLGLYLAVQKKLVATMISLGFQVLPWSDCYMQTTHIVVDK